MTPKLDIFKCFSDKTPYLVQLDVLEEIRKSSGIEEFVDPLTYMDEHQEEANTIEFKGKCQLLFLESLLRKYQELVDWKCNKEDNESSPELNAFIEDTKTHFPEFFETAESSDSIEVDNSENNLKKRDICGPQAFLNSFKYILSSQNEMKLILHSNLSNEELVRLASTLYTPLLKYPKCGETWLKDIYSFFKLPLAEWIVSVTKNI